MRWRGEQPGVRNNSTALLNVCQDGCRVVRVLVDGREVLWLTLYR